MANSNPPVRVMLARRPKPNQTGAFGHVDVSAAARRELDSIIQKIRADATGRKEIPYHPDDQPDEGEVLTGALQGFDSHFQPNAAWSLERAVAEVRRSGLPATLSVKEIPGGGWTFYAIREKIGTSDVVLIRAKSPTYGLSGPNKLLTSFIGTELRPVTAPLVAFDHVADVVVVNQKVYVLRPRSTERNFVDADAVKARAPQTASSFDSKIAASLAPATLDAIQRVCSQDANVARRAERLIRDDMLKNVSAAKVRAALPDARLAKEDMGKSGPLVAPTDERAKALIDIAADLYYQPRFESNPRRVAAYRKL